MVKIPKKKVCKIPKIRGHGKNTKKKKFVTYQKYGDTPWPRSQNHGFFLITT
jgi:hypothetical protein